MAKSKDKTSHPKKGLDKKALIEGMSSSVCPLAIQPPKFDRAVEFYVDRSKTDKEYSKEQRTIFLRATTDNQTVGAIALVLSIEYGFAFRCTDRTIAHLCGHLVFPR